MFGNFNRARKLISLMILAILIIGSEYLDSQAQESDLAQATFYVY